MAHLLKDINFENNIGQNKAPVHEMTLPITIYALISAFLRTSTRAKVEARFGTSTNKMENVVERQF